MGFKQNVKMDTVWPPAHYPVNENSVGFGFTQKEEMVTEYDPNTLIQKTETEL